MLLPVFSDITQKIRRVLNKTKQNEHVYCILGKIFGRPLYLYPNVRPFKFGGILNVIHQGLFAPLF